MRALINAVTAVSLVILVASLSFLLYYKATFKPSASFKGKEEVTAVTPPENSSASSLSSGREEDVPDEVLSQVENLKPIVTSYFVTVKNGPSVYPALVFKVNSNGKGLTLYLLTFYPMEWPFVKVNVLGERFGSPGKVYRYPGGLLLLEYSVRGIFPVEVERGKVGDYGVLVTWTGNSFDVGVYDSKKGCTDNGFVFNLAGDFAGVCFGGNFYSAEELYSTVPDVCTLTYEKEEGSGNLQGENGQLVR